MASKFSMVYVTAKDKTEAEHISRHLLSKRLVACSNIFPVRSFYHWKGKVEDTDEMALVLKTRTSLVKPVMKEVRKIHSYEVPCIVVYPMDTGLPEYLDWILSETKSRRERSIKR